MDGMIRDEKDMCLVEFGHRDYIGSDEIIVAFENILKESQDLNTENSTNSKSLN